MSVSYLCAVGIDLGTTYSSIGRFDSQGSILLFQDKVNSSPWIPSVVSYAKSCVKVGNLALDDQRKYPKEVIVDAKRMIGRYYNDNIIQELKQKWLFKIRSSNDGGIEIETSQGPKKPVEVCRDIIKYLLELAKEHSENKKITHAVISVPANYNSFQREETKKAAEMAGLKVVHLINEPTAGITSYWFSNCGRYLGNNGRKTVLTYDFGGGTLDISLAQVVGDNIEIVAVKGEMEIGGRDIDNNLVDYYLNKLGITGLRGEMKLEGRIGERARTYMRKITDECHKAKISFSKLDKECAIYPDIDLDRYDVDDQEVIITKQTFYSINQNIINRLTCPIEDIFNEAKSKGLNINKNNLTDVILIGGSSYNKFVTESLLHYFKKMPIRNNDPRNAVVKGAAIDARRRYVDNHCSMPELNALEVHDVCPLSLGVAIVGRKMLTIIKRNSTIPISNEVSLYTLNNFDDSATFKIHETERTLTTDESLIGTLTLEIPSKQAGEVNMMLKLSLDEDGILKSSAWVDGESLTYSSESIIRGRKKYSQREIRRMIDLAKEEEENDIRKTNEMKLQTMWESLHDNVISFIAKYRFEVSKQSILNAFKRIENIAYNKRNETISNKFEYDSMVDKYNAMFEEYNKSVLFFKQTNFLRHYDG